MGIPHLITHLEPYAVNTPIKDAHVVVDGPGLAFHIYHICCTLNSRARGPIEAQPSYDLIAEAAIGWLDQLRACGVEIEKIYFDGFLPPSKRTVRLERLIQSSNQLKTCNQKLGTPVRITSFRPSLQAKKLFVPTATSLSSSKLPAAPFLVPAVIEALLTREEYHKITEVIPGEADAFCAQYACQSIHNVTVLTGDSDLLVQYLGPLGGVCLFRHMTFPGEMSSTVRFLKFQPALIAERLELSAAHGLKALAFEMIMDPHATVPQLLERAKALKSITAHPSMYETFSEDYKPEIDFKGQHLARDVLERLDPRTSEVVLQFLKPQAAAASPSSRSIDAFPPFAIDSPLKTSAWQVSSGIRSIAYTLLGSVSPASVASVNEHRRTATTVKGRLGSTGKAVDLMAGDELEVACRQLTHIIDKGSLHSEDLWLILAICQEVQWMLAEEKIPWAKRVWRLSKTCAAKAPNITDWDTIHFVSQIQCSYYSLRMLSQVLDVIHDIQSGREPDHVSSLRTKLQFLPPLRKLPSIGQLAQKLLGSQGAVLVAAAYELLDLGQYLQEEEKSKSRKKRKKTKTSDAEDPLPAKRSTNPFDLLMQE